jgi:hypothetical protein
LYEETWLHHVKDSVWGGSPVASSSYRLIH